MTRLKQKIYRGGMVAAVLAVAALPMAVGAQAVPATDDTTITATIGQTISMTIEDDPAPMTLNPGVTPDEDTASHTVSVSTNHTGGYDLTLAASDTALTSADDDTISALSGGPRALDDNTWGYSVGTGEPTSWTGVTNNEESIAGSIGAVASDPTTVWYGVRVNVSQQPGAYTGTVTYTATTN